MINFKEFLTRQYWSKYITYDFWFGIDRLQIHNVDYAALTLAAALVLLSAALAVYAKTRDNPFTKKLLKRCAKLCVTIGILGLMWFGLRWQNIMFFGTHFVADLILLIGVVWGLVLVRYRFKRFPEEVRTWEKDQLKQKYLNYR